MRRFGERNRVFETRRGYRRAGLFAARTRLDTTLRRGAVLACLALAGVLGHLWLQSFHFGSDSVAARHVLAYLSCDAAYSAGLTPSSPGRPGYWRKLDYDRDGVSCERYDPAHPERYRPNERVRAPGRYLRP